jgi:hypothetical protein
MKTITTTLTNNYKQINKKLFFLFLFFKLLVTHSCITLSSTSSMTTDDDDDDGILRKEMVLQVNEDNPTNTPTPVSSNLGIVKTLVTLSISLLFNTRQAKDGWLPANNTSGK